MKRWTVIFILALFTFFSLANDATARRRHHYGYGLGIHFLFALPLIYGLYHSHGHHYPSHHHHYDHYNSNSLNRNDRLLLSEKTHYTLENVRSGTEVNWFNPNTGVEGTVVERPAFKNSRGAVLQGLRANHPVRKMDTAGNRHRLQTGGWEMGKTSKLLIHSSRRPSRSSARREVCRIPEQKEQLRKNPGPRPQREGLRRLIKITIRRFRARPFFVSLLASS